MKITKTQLKKIIKEELEEAMLTLETFETSSDDRFKPGGPSLQEGGGSGLEFEGTKTNIEFLGMETKYDQTEIKLRINEEEFRTTGAYDIDSLADEIISELEEDDEYWFLGEYGEEDMALAFKTKLEGILEAIGANPEGEDEARTSYRDRDTGGTY